VQQPTTEITIKPLEFDSVLERGGLVGLLLAPPDYGVLPRIGWTFPETVDAPEVGARAVELTCSP
jgi:hypothetical protein